jgi:glucuronoarabinoxylan endo-1,4-beta-xylanase
MRFPSPVKALFRGTALALAGLFTQGMSADCTIQFNSLLQHMSGFGGSTAWKNGLTDSLITRLFSTTQGCGLSLVRMHINGDGSIGSGELAIAKKAYALGASLWGAPWSPAASYKDNNNVNNGGALLTAHYQDWADKLAALAKKMDSQGTPLKWISAQNEPNWTADYESCIYTAAQMTTFVGKNLGPALEKAGVKTRVIAPEVINFGALKPFGDALLNDADAVKYLDVIATHQYGSGPTGTGWPYKLVADKGKELWETEHGMDNYAGDESMKGGIPLAKEMHLDIVNGPVSAYHVWWIIPADGETGTASNGLMMKGHICQRGYVMGNYSRFVRPGSYRITATDAPTAGISVTAYRNDSSGTLAIVAFNETSAAVTQKFVLNGVTVPSVVPWETSDAVKLTARDPVTVSGGGFSWPIPGMSVITFVGKYTPSAIGARQARGAEKPYRGLSMGGNALTAEVRETGDYTLAVYDLEGAQLGAYSGKGPGKRTVSLRPGPAGMVLVKFVASGQRSFEERVFRGR